MFRNDLFANSKVLIVDDIAENLQILGGLLYRNGLKVAVATNGEQGLASAKSMIPDLILLDVTMPDMDGFTVCKELQKDPNTADIPIIFLTARTAIEDIAYGFEIGGVDYITKPYNHKELLSRVHNHLELKKSKELLKQQNNELQELNKQKDKFLSIVSHDLRSPFSGLKGLMGTIIDDFDSFDKETLKEYLTIMGNSLNTQYLFLENLLDWGNLQLGRKEINKTEVNLKELIDVVANIFYHTALMKSIKIEFDIDENIVCYASQTMLQAIIQNLISNAIKFTPQGGIISISAVNSEDFVTISIKDSGVGIRDEEKSKIFKLDKIYTTMGTNQEMGTGLGLLLVQEMVIKNGGTIWFESEIGKGTTFHFTMPNE